MTRYSRQEIFLGRNAQKKIKKSVIAVVGLGGTGSVCANVLARSGANMILVDRDVVEKSNLHRQLYNERDIGTPKALAMKSIIEKANSEIKIEAFFDDFTENLWDRVKKACVIVDCTDNMETRFLLSHLCMKHKKPVVHAAATGSEGMLMTTMPGRKPCFCCVFSGKKSGETCETSGVLGTATSAMGTLAAGEALKIVTGIGSVQKGLLRIDFGKNTYETLSAKKNKHCRMCSGKYFRSYVQPFCGGYRIRVDVDVKHIKKMLQKAGESYNIQTSAFNDALFVKFEGKEVTIFPHSILVRNVSTEKAAIRVASKLVPL